MSNLPTTKKETKELSTIIRDVLADEDLFKAIISKSKNKPVYYELLQDRKTFGYGIAVSMAIKALAGDVQAANYIMKAGGFEKIDIGIHSDFYNDNRLEIEVLTPETQNNLLKETTNEVVGKIKESLREDDYTHDESGDDEIFEDDTVESEVINENSRS